MKKKALSLALVLVVCLGLAIPAFAADSDFVIKDGVLIKYNGPGGDVTIPSGVSKIGWDAFANCKGLTRVVIPEGVFLVERGAFNRCPNLTEVVFPDSLYEIDDDAFSWCGKLEELHIPSGVKDIGRYAFSETPLMERYDDGKFVIVDGVLLWYSGPGGEVIVPDTVTRIGRDAFSPCETITSVVIPSSVTTIGHGAFSLCPNLTGVTLSEGLIEIGHRNFQSCQLVEIIFPASLIKLESGTFKDNTAIQKVTFLNGDTELHPYGFISEEQGKNPQLYPTPHPLSVTFSAPAGGKVEAFCNGDNGCEFTYSFEALSLAPAQPETASPTNDKLEVNGAAANPTVYKIDGSNYFKIRDVAALLNGTEKQFAVGYDGEKNAVTATPGQGYDKLDTDLAGAPAGGDQTAEPSNDTIYINGEKAEVEVYKIDGSNYFKLRDLGQTLNFYVGWSAERGMYIETDKPYTE